MRSIMIVLLLLSSQSVSALTIEARNARIKTVGGEQQKLWNLWSNGKLGDFVDFKASGRYRLAVVVKGSPALDVWPNMAVAIDGTVLDRVDVNSRDLKAFTFLLHVSAGDHRITIQFSNDLLTVDEDRNLYLKQFSIEPLEGQNDPALGDEARWQAAFKKKEEKIEKQVLDQSAALIEKLRKEDATVIVENHAGEAIKGASVKIEQMDHQFLFGCNIYAFDRFKTEADNEKYKRRFAELFNYATTGFYWASYEPVKGKPRYAYTDRVVEWCRKHHIRMKGHPLLWEHHAGKPKWAGGKQPVQDIQRERVFDIMQRYSGKIGFWEVVNEPSHLPGLKIDAPYRWARKADPKAYLIVNDYYVMADGHPPFFQLMKKAIDGGVPFDGIGIQAHEPRTMRFPLQAIRRTLDHYGTLGKELHITEFTPTSGGQPITDSHIVGVWDEEAQADYAVKFYSVCFAHPAVVAITWWDLCDSHAWLKGGGLLRPDLTPKSAYLALKKLIREDWTTRRQGRTDKNGHFDFRGFRGTYIVKIEWNGKTTECRFALKRNALNRVKVAIE